MAMNFRTSIETCFKKFADFKEELLDQSFGIFIY